MGSFDQPSQVQRDNMGNTAARQRLKAQDFAYISRNTAFLSRDIVSDYYTELMTMKVANVEKTDGKIPLHTIGMLLYLFCDGKTEDNLGQMFNLFDEDGNGSINVEELLNMMAFFIEIGADAGSVDLATVMAEMFQSGDRNNDEKLTKAEFEKGMMSHPVISGLLKVKTIDALLSTF